MGVEEPAQHSQAGKRSVKRARVLLTAKLQTARGEVDVRLRDLSRRGALLECNDRFPVGDEVVFARGDTVVPARVAWAGGNRIGIEFVHPIEESEVLIHVSRAPVVQTQTRFRRPSFSESLSDYDRKLARVMGASLGVRLIDE